MSEPLTLPDVVHDAPAVSPGPVEPGSDAHRVLFCRALLDTFTAYCPSVEGWPALDAEARARLAALPIWDMAVSTERRAGARVRAFAERVADPLLRQAVALNAFEEERHERVLTTLAAAYGISVAPPPHVPAPRDPEWGYLRTGYGECLDTFFAFGLFEVGRRAGLFPSSLVAAFEPVIEEEGRHIVFFVNWVAWHRRNMPAWRRPWFALKVALVWVTLLLERLGLVVAALRGQPDEATFTATGARAFDVDLDAAAFLRLCLAEDARRLGAHDPRLLRPRFMPAVARLACRVLEGLPRRRAVAPGG